MHVDKHDLVHEFPQYRERIHELKLHNSHFKNLFEKYHSTDLQVKRAEEGTEHLSDAHLETLKRERLHLKDQLFEMLRGN